MGNNILHDEAREKDVQRLCDAILYKSINLTGDYGMGGECPFCFAGCSWNDSISDIIHEADCVYLIAKDLSTNLL